ncbi:MAG TPA: NYN domain-containing protein [Candidatus Limnocylindrales bacterium]
MPATPHGSRPAHGTAPAHAARSSRSPLEGISRLLVDGTNLLYRIGQGGSKGAAPPAAVIGRLRAAVPGTVTIDLVFDGIGHGVFGRVAQGMTVRYSGRRTADDVILDLTSEAAMQAAAEQVLIVTNDRELRGLLHAKGAKTVPLRWLMGRLDLPVNASPSPGNKRPPSIGAGAPPKDGGDVDDERRSTWKPGRGATTKTGPPRKVARHKRHPRMGA